MLNMAPGDVGTDTYFIIRVVLLVLIVLCALFMIFVVLIQPGNSSGLGAVSGSSETFLGKNKSKTREGRMKRLTVIVAALFVVLLIVFAVISIV
jgi:preprotein translocase subunit SecG